MRQEHQQQGWVSGGVSYPLIYQTVRRADNEVNSFQVSDVALGTDKYEEDYENLKRQDHGYHMGSIERYVWEVKHFVQLHFLMMWMITWKTYW